MLDIKWIRDHPDLFDYNLKRRGQDPLSAQILEIDHARRYAQTSLQEIQNERNALAKHIGAQKQQGLDTKDLMLKASSFRDSISTLEQEEQTHAQHLHTILSILPNILDDDVPEGIDETSNLEVRRWGDSRVFDFSPLSHYELGESLGLMDFEAAVKMSGSRFAVLRGALARLERALGQFMLDVHCQEFGYQEISPPLLVRGEALYGTGQLPKFAHDSFQTTDGKWLIPTAEISLTNLTREMILEEEKLPLRVTALTPCFRSEAGAAGRDTRGMIRQHQFYKVELVSITAPSQSFEEHHRMVRAAETILERLNLPYRVMKLSAGDTSANSRCTYDLEVWMPSENTYREISSCSNCGDYQARRLQTRFRKAQIAHSKGTLDFVHTLNGSGVAVGRALVAVLENYQNSNRSIDIPEVLIPYMKGLKRISVDD